MGHEKLTDCTLRSTVLWIAYVRMCEYTLCMKRWSVCVLCGVRVVYVAWRGVVCVCCVLCALYMYNKTEQIWQDGAVPDRMGDSSVVCVWCGVNV
jgi:hypothetical protein